MFTGSHDGPMTLRCSDEIVYGVLRFVFPQELFSDNEMIREGGAPDMMMMMMMMMIKI